MLRAALRLIASIAFAGWIAWSAVYAQPNIQRKDFFIASDPGIRLFVREVSASRATSHVPILLIHGARIPGIASFDLPVAGGSLAADLATSGFDAYVMDVRGYGRSTRPAEMDGQPNAHPPSVRSNEAVRDIASAVDWIEHREHVSAVALFGWATGAQWAGYYASHYPEKEIGRAHV